MSNWKPVKKIETDEDHAQAIKNIEILMEKDDRTGPEEAELMILVALVEIYEEKRWPMGGNAP